MARLAAAEAAAERDAAAAAAAEAAEDAAARQATLDRLEEDLLAAQRRGGAGRGGGGEAGGEGDAGALAAVAAAGGGGGGDEDGAVVNVLVAQRDRFRAKALEAEGELAGARQALAAAKAEAAGVRSDNAALVGRLRYVQGFAAARGEDAEAGRGGPAGGNPSSAAAAAAVAAKYERAYDDSVNPFREFQGQQRERQRRAMAAPDRAMYALATLVAGSRASRLFIFAYLAALHVLVFSSMARMASASSTALTAHTESVLLGSRSDATAAMHGGAGR